MFKTNCTKNRKCKEIKKLKWHREKDSNPHSHHIKMVCLAIRLSRYVNVLLNPNSVLIFTRLVHAEYRFPPLVQAIGSAPIRVSYYPTTTNNKNLRKSIRRSPPYIVNCACMSSHLVVVRTKDLARGFSYIAVSMSIIKSLYCS